MLPAGLTAHINLRSWPRQPVFDWLQETAALPLEPFANTFNCGIGMVLAVAPDDVETALNTLAAAGEQATVIGEVGAAGGDPAIILHP